MKVIISELTKTQESKDVTNEQVLAWAKGVEAQKVQFTIIKSLNETEDFDNVGTLRGEVTIINSLNETEVL